MTLDALAGLVGLLPWFDLATVIQLTGERRKSVVHQLHRLVKAGKVISLRRGMYVLAERYRRAPVQPAELAGALYRPSYLSGVWALSYYGLIPEGVSVFTSVTSRSPRRFDNAFGEYRYRHVKRSLFFGALPVMMSGRRVMVASPEKALVDHWHLTPGEWAVDRMREMRFAASDLVDTERLASMVQATGMPRLERAYRVWHGLVSEERTGEVVM